MSPTDASKPSKGSLLNTGNVGKASPKGRYSHVMCDREKQMSEFGNFIRTKVRLRPGLPQFYFLHGEEGQGHQSFVQRIRIDKIERRAVSEKGVMEGGAMHIEHWPQRLQSLENTKEDFISSMFERISDFYNIDRTSVRDLCGHPKLKLFHFVVLEHNFEVEKWEGQLEALVEWYLNTYWMEYAPGVSQTQFLVFLNFIYPPPGFFGWRRRLPSHQPGERFLREISASLDQTFPCLLFRELGHLEKAEVCRTLRGKYHHAEACPDWLEELFRKKGKKVKMSDVENLLTSLEFARP